MNILDYITTAKDYQLEIARDKMIDLRKECSDNLTEAIAKEMRYAIEAEIKDRKRPRWKFVYNSPGGAEVYHKRDRIMMVYEDRIVIYYGGLDPKDKDKLMPVYANSSMGRARS